MSKLRMFAKLKAKKKDDKKATVEGDAPRQRLDRPSRMRRADGGPAISKDSKQEAARLRADANESARMAGSLGGWGGGALLGTKIAGAGKVGRILAKGAAALAGVGTAAEAANAVSKTTEANRIERGQAEPGKEDRKRGGRVKS